MHRPQRATMKTLPTPIGAEMPLFSPAPSLRTGRGESSTPSPPVAGTLRDRLAAALAAVDVSNPNFAKVDRQSAIVMS